MKNLFQVEKVLNDIYKILDSENKNLSDEEKIKKSWILSIEGLEAIEGLRKDIKKFTRDY